MQMNLFIAIGVDEAGKNTEKQFLMMEKNDFSKQENFFLVLIKKLV